MVMTMLRRCVGEKQAFDLVATGRVLNADEAKQLGLVSRVFPTLEFDVRSAGVLKQLAQTPASAMGATKTLFYKMDSQSFLDGITAGIVANADARATGEFREGVKKFTARKKDTQ
jgi:methylglutaconyl-CoA hydratase